MAVAIIRCALCPLRPLLPACRTRPQLSLTSPAFDPSCGKGDFVIASRQRFSAQPFDGAIPGTFADITDGTADAACAASAKTSVSAPPEVLLGLLDLRDLAAIFATAANVDVELWLRYLQARAPDLLASLAAGTRRAATATPTTASGLGALPASSDAGGLARSSGEPDADCWLAALRGFMLLRWRRYVGGPQLLDGVHMRDLLIGPCLGEGAFGQVYLARHRVLPDRWYAVKRQQLGRQAASKARQSQQLTYLEREREVLLLLARESRGKSDINLFVQLITYGQDASQLQLAMTAVLGGELFHLLQETGAMAESEVQFYAANICAALQHLHSLGMAYRDLKTENVLLSGGFTHAAAGWPVLADFGLANWVKHDGSSLQTFCGTPAFIAPEIAAQNGYGTAADWWSLGILIYQCLTLRTPFEGPTARATIENIIHGRRVNVGVGGVGPGGGQAVPPLSENAKGMIEALLTPDPAERLGGPLHPKVRTEPFFWGFDWTQIEKRQMTPPHAARCRKRAVAATQHPALQLPPLPDLSAGLGKGANGDAAAMEGKLPRGLPSAVFDRMTTIEMDQMEGARAGGGGSISAGVVSTEDEIDLAFRREMASMFFAPQ